VDWDLVKKQYLGGASLSKIAKRLDCSVNFVSKELKARGVIIRDFKTQVSLDCANGVDGHAIINEQFFDTWSPKMAYVLGWIVSDGNIANTLKTFRICSTDIEHLRNIANLFSSGAHIIIREFQEDRWKTAGELSVGRRHMVDSLVKLGITPHKSNTIKMPDIPDKYFGHFLRGVFEGDGHVGVKLSKGKYPQLKVVVVSGSFDFIDALGKRIEKLIGPRFKGVCWNQSVWHLSYYSFNDCKLIFDAMYSDVPLNMILERKYSVFKRFFALKGGDSNNATDEQLPGGLQQPAEGRSRSRLGTAKR
jgi:hypothetical protein